MPSFGSSTRACSVLESYSFGIKPAVKKSFGNFVIHYQADHYVVDQCFTYTLPLATEALRLCLV